VDVTNPLGLSAEQERQSALHAWFRDMPARIAHNRAVVEALPPGTVVRMQGSGGTYPDMTREQILEIML